MVIERIPVDELTGLPYCFAPCNTLPPISQSLNESGQRLADWDHAYPKYEVQTSPNLQYGLLGRVALQSSRAQWVDFLQHHEKKNELLGPLMPETSQELFKTLVFAESGYIPDMALDFSGSRPKYVRLETPEQKFLWQSGQVRVFCEADVRNYLRDYILNQDTDHIKEKELEEFLTTYDFEKRIYLGHCLAAKMVERAVEPMESSYRAVRRLGHLVEAPTHPRDFVKKQLTTGRGFGRIFDGLHKVLAPQRPHRKQEREQIAA